MHELCLTEGLLRVVLEHAESAQARCVSHINLVMGEMSGIVCDSVQFCFDLLSKDTIADGAKLSFRFEPMEVSCRMCGTIFPLNQSGWDCPSCHEWDAQIVSGHEFYVESIEVD
ncbi:MAG: hydrogenase maturation nickel metallochaperone HypA [Chloroflexota bacterium]|nr:hydrogenase maturation nickel metallochaperone HypA [Chloroflexota bacterium]